MIDTGTVIMQMLEKAEEIQALCSGGEGNYFFDHHLKYGSRDMKYDGYVEYGGGKRQQFRTYDGYLWHGIWVPQQHQYQDMLSMSLSKLALNIQSYYNGLSEDSWTPDDWVPQTMDQLQCFMVMASNHNKRWNGKEFALEKLP